MIARNVGGSLQFTVIEQKQTHILKRSLDWNRITGS